MTRVVRSFPPIEDARARVLVLGSMPGLVSLRAGQYYAHPQNAFWPIMGELFGAGPAIAYEKRVQVLIQAGVAIWDVMASCIREGSLDAEIEEGSIVPNDLRAFFESHQRVAHVYFNGAKAESSFRRYVLPLPPGPLLRYARLPSTSPAHASLSLSQKIESWRAMTSALSGG